MINRSGWIKIHRKLWSNPISRRPEYAWLWITLISLANHSDSSFIWNGRRQKLRRGQLLTGRKALSAKTGISQSSVYRILKYLENEQQIEQHKTSKFTVITVINYDEYQQGEQQCEQQMNNRWTTDEQQMNTYKNNKKNNKNEKKEIYNLSWFRKNKDRIITEVKGKYPNKNVEKAYQDCLEYAEINAPKWKNYSLAFQRWVREDTYGKYKISPVVTTYKKWEPPPDEDYCAMPDEIKQLKQRLHTSISF
jgi:hypothetical protein